MKKQKILITGGAGFIGSHIQDRLIKEGHEVLIIDSMRSGRIENLNPESRFFQSDVRDKDTLKKIFKYFQPEAVFHLAAQNEVPYSMTHPLEDQEINILGMINLLECCVEFKTSKIIYSNTGGAFYGEVAELELPIKEDQIVLKPTSFYGVSKSSAESYLKLYGNLYSLNWVSLRYSNVYGPRQMGNKEAGIIAIFTEKLLNHEIPTINGDGSHTRDYIFVMDVVEANFKALSYKESNYFNISTGVETSNIQIFHAIEDNLKTGIKPNFGPNRPGDPFRNCLDPSKAKLNLNWSPKVEVNSGIETTLNYYRNLD